MAAVLLSFILCVEGCSWVQRERRIRDEIKTDYGIRDPQFKRAMEGLLGSPIVGGNDVVELLNGDRIFPAMLEAIRGARKSITLEMYIWSSGKVSDPFVDAFIDRAKAGVKVYIIVDAVGSARLKDKEIRKMKEAGVHFVKYNQPLSFRFFRANLRTHRKLTVVDGKIGFIGGVCISDDWQGNAEPGRWRESHFRVEGPVVAQLQSAFMDNWIQMKSEVLHGEEFFPKLEKKGSMEAQGVHSGPKDHAEDTRMTYLLSFAAARKTIRISHAYFAPDTLMIDTLVAAVERGVDVQIIIPKKIDNVAVKWASRPRLTRLAKAGARFWEYEPTLYHTKVVIVDDVWSIVGSVNFDERSFKLNDEANLNVYDEAFARKLIATFEADKARSKPISKDELLERNFLLRWKDHFFGLFRPQL